LPKTEVSAWLNDGLVRPDDRALFDLPSQAGAINATLQSNRMG
jgi:hypothetical protein